ncbi:MAG: hypothetical protein ABSF54_19150, partial [Bryobacteraceae bacterium]
EGDRLARAFDADGLGRLARYEGSIERSIDRCLRQLKMYQAERIASTPPPAPAPTPSNSESCHSNPILEGGQFCPQPAFSRLLAGYGYACPPSNLCSP